MHATIHFKKLLKQEHINANPNIQTGVKLKFVAHTTEYNDYQVVKFL